MSWLSDAWSWTIGRKRKREEEEEEQVEAAGTPAPTPPPPISLAAAASAPSPLPTDVSESSRETKRVLLEQLSCPVCLCSPLLPPARQCPNGHLLCDACSKQPACAKCPTCRSAPTNIRCLALEKVAGAEGMSAPCPHCDIDIVRATAPARSLARIWPSARPGARLALPSLHMHPRAPVSR